jgi:membrane protease YdiL (CAAX protease family)
VAPTFPLAVAIAVIPSFGVLLYVAGIAARRSQLALALVTRHAAIVYTTMLCAAVVVLAVGGVLPLDALVDPGLAAWRVALGLALVVPCAVAPYLVELLLSSRLAGRGGPLEAGALLPDAGDSVEAVAVSRTRFGAVALLTAVAEELLFRGAVLHSLVDTRGLLVAVALTSLVFGLHHVSFGLAAVLGKAVAGVTWALLMVLSGLLLVPILAHLLFQALVLRRMNRRRA